MPLELMYESPKRGSGAPLRSSWIAESDTKACSHLAGKGWRIVDRRETSAPVTDDEPLRTVATVIGAEVVTELPVIDDAQLITVELGVTVQQLEALIAAGIDTIGKLRAAPDDRLRAINGIGPAAVRNIRKALAGK